MSTKTDTKKPTIVGLLDRTREELSCTSEGFYIEIFPGSTPTQEKKDGKRVYAKSDTEPMKLYISNGNTKLIIPTLTCARILKLLTQEFKTEFDASVVIAKRQAEERLKQRTDELKEI